jgi:DNA-binding GntR family transcriptional regulator
MLDDDLDTLQDGSSLRGTTYHRVYKAILSDIVNGTFAPGARLKIADLCKRYGLSQMPIREALQLLQGEGFVVMTPNKGASVRPINRKFLSDIYDVRGALYAIVYRDVIAWADPAFDRSLSDIQKRFDAAVEDNDLRGAQDMNRLLHATIEALCTNAEVTKLSRKYADLTSSLRDVLGFNVARLRQISQEHWHIIDAVRDRDVGRAVAAAQVHVTKALENISQHFDDGRKVS